MHNKNKKSATFRYVRGFSHQNFASKLRIKTSHQNFASKLRIKTSHQNFASKLRISINQVHSVRALFQPTLE